MPLPRKNRSLLDDQSEANEQIVSRIEEWLPELDAPLEWVRPAGEELDQPEADPEVREPSFRS